MMDSQMMTGRRTGLLNVGSLATEYDWRWEDFSECLDRLCDEYTMPENWPVCVFDYFKLDRDNLPLAVFLADKEQQLNGWDAAAGTSSQLFGHLTRSNCVYADRMVSWLLPVAVLELETGQNCRLCLLHGIDRYVYPRLVQGLKNHGYQRGR